MTGQIRTHAFSFFSTGVRHRSALLSSVLLLLTSVLTDGCSPYRPIERQKNALLLAGFTNHPADTTARWAMMDLLPPNTMTYRLLGKNPVILYADPIQCGCVYMGDTNAYQAYRKRYPAAPLEEQRMTAEIADHPGWDWSVWDQRADPDVTNGLRHR